MTQAEQFWRQQLKGFTSPTSLVVAKAWGGLSDRDIEHHKRRHKLSVKETEKLKLVVRHHHLTFPTLVEGVWAVLLSRYAAERDILFGVVSEGRIFPFRIKVNLQEAVSSWLTKFHDQRKRQRQFESPSLKQIREWGEISSTLPLFESLVVFQQEDSGEMPAEIKDYPFVLTPSVDAELLLEIRYDKTRFESEAMARMLGHLQTLLVTIAEAPEQPLANISLLTEKELHQITVDWNNTEIDFPEDKCLHQLFEAQVEDTPDATAVIFTDEKLTYQELNRRANQLAHYLRKLGVGPDVLVGMFMERSLEMVVGLYGILKAGGAYVPMDPSYPKERLQFMIADTRVPVLLTQEQLVEKLPAHQAQTVVIDSEWEKISEEGNDNPGSVVTPEHLAYVIYTSGSTGRPKGAVLNHRGRVNNFCDFNRRYSVGPGDKVLGLASLSFDMHAYDNFGLMAAGGANVIVESSAVLEPARWAELMLHHEITVWHSVPALLEMYVDYISERQELWPKSLRLVLLGGDWIPVNLPDRLKSMVKGVQVVSMGGATECSMDSTIYDIENSSSGWKSIPYGVPMANQLAYVLDPYFNLVPVGVPGELYLGGVGVGRGYHSRPQLTAEKFVPNPFSGVPGDRMYRTGDLARYMPDGNLELLGRIDFQVKVRGFRVELGEIASTLTQHPNVKEATVVAKDIEEGVPAKGKQVVGYVVPESGIVDSQQPPSDDWDKAQLNQWQQIYEETYSETSDTGDPTFNISTWNSSYTGLPIPEEEMREWVKQSIDRILSLKPRRVLELACGTGLLLFRVAPHCEKYLGIDFSKVALDYIRRQLQKPDLQLPRVSLMQRTADNFEGIEPDSFDLVILHSVVQLFPGVDYFLRVLEGAVKAVQPGGRIYIGDVISLPLMEAFHTSVQLYQAPSWVTREQLRQRIKKAGDKEEQLFIHPAFFQALTRRFPKITNVDIQLRRGQYQNEMTRFRYDVVLHIAEQVDSSVEVEWLDWQKEDLSVAEIKTLLRDRKPELLGISKVPNVRLAEEIKAIELLADSDGPATVGELRNNLRQTSDNGFVDPEELWAIQDDLPYDVHITWSAAGSCGTFDVVFQQRKSDDRARRIIPHYSEPATSARSWQSYANNPLQSILVRQLVPKLRTYLQERLPDYMVPTAFVLLDGLPLSPNGKVDRRALPPPEQSRPELTAEFVPPRDPVEEVVASVWADVFEFERVGIHDNFLEMGGHSLLATQIMARLREIFPVDLPLRYLFASPTVAELSACIRTSGDDAQVDVSEIARTLLEVDQLSDEEVKSMLANQATDE